MFLMNTVSMILLNHSFTFAEDGLIKAYKLSEQPFEVLLPSIHLYVELTFPSIDPPLFRDF